MLTRRALLKSAALSAGGLIRVRSNSYDIAIQAVSASTARILILPVKAAGTGDILDDGALVRPEWPRLRRGELDVEVTPDLTIRVRQRKQLVQQLRADRHIPAHSLTILRLKLQ